jgi:hypothetical protein
MKIYLTTILDSEDNEVELFYQTLKPFDEHSEDVQNFIENKINELTPIEEQFTDGGIVPRLHKQIYQINDTLQMAKVYEYQYPANHPQNGIIQSLKLQYHGN